MLSMVHTDQRMFSMHRIGAGNVYRIHFPAGHHFLQIRIDGSASIFCRKIAPLLLCAGVYSSKDKLLILKTGLNEAVCNPVGAYDPESNSHE
ncbi:hypothetical protein D3C87_1846680 [compost metagenome]